MEKSIVFEVFSNTFRDSTVWPTHPHSRTMPEALYWSWGGWAFFVSEVPMYRLPPTTHALTLTTYHVIKRQFLIYGPEQSNHQPQTESTSPSTFQMHDVAVEKTIVFEVFSKEASGSACRKHSAGNLSGLVVCRSLFGLADLVSPGFFSLRS